MTKEHEVTSPPSDAIAPMKRRRSNVTWLALLAILIALGCWFQLAHQQKKTTHNYSQLQDSFNQTESNTVQLNETINALKTQMAQQNEALQTLQIALNRMQLMHSNYEVDFALQQSSRYIEQASLSLSFNHNTDDAIALLQAADQRLKNVADPHIIDLRNHIAHTVVQLEAIPTLDYVGILTKIAALRDQVAHVPLFAIDSKINIFQKENAPTASTTAPQSSWRLAWDKTLSTLGSLIIIRNRHQEITPLVLPVQEAFLRQNLQLILQQAQWAVLQHQQEVYQFSLNQASEWLQRYFSDNDKASEAFQSDIKALLSIPLNPKLPDLAPLTTQLTLIIKARAASENNGTPKVASSPSPTVAPKRDDDDKTVASSPPHLSSPSLKGNLV